MDVASWGHRKHGMLQELRFNAGVVPDLQGLLACRIISFDNNWGEAMLLDLRLGNSFEEAPRLRRPGLQDDRVSFARAPSTDLQLGDDYMLVGATVVFRKGPMPHMLEWPAISETTGYVRLPKHSPTVAEVAEFFAGGLNAWTRAVELLPMRVTMRVDCKKFACQMMTINDREREARGHDDTPPIFDSDVADMRVLSQLRNEEAILASPPCQPFSSLGRGQGLDAFSARSWDSLFRAIRVSQRRYCVLENVCGLLRHPDFQEIMRAFRYCGYILVAKRVCDATPLACAARPRVILVLWNNADWNDTRCPQAQVQSIAAMGSPVSCKDSGSLWHSLPEPLLQELLLTQAEYDLLSQRAFLPQWLRHSHRPVWDLRTVQEDKPFPSQEC